jgi:hypothetical protein
MARDDQSGNAGGRDRDRGDDRHRGGADQPDEYDEDLARDNRRGREGEGMSDLAAETRAGNAGFTPSDGVEDRHGWRSHARRGQAESPVELNHNEPPRKKEGHD